MPNDVQTRGADFAVGHAGHRMNRRNQAARIVVASGSISLIVLAVLHLRDFSKDMQHAAGLSAPLLGAFRAIFVLVGWQWIVVGVIAFFAAFRASNLRRVLILFCGFAVLVQAALTYTFMGVFLGTELMLVAAVLISAGGLLFPNRS
jgi:hypothetical protein